MEKTCFHACKIASLSVPALQLSPVYYNAGPPMAIPIYTVLLYCVIGSRIYKKYTDHSADFMPMSSVVLTVACVLCVNNQQTFAVAI